MTATDRNAEAEYNIIGAICKDQRVVEKIAPKLSEEDFTISACADIYAAAVDATERGKSFDGVCAVDVLVKKMEPEEAAAFVKECIDVTPTTANAELHADLVHKHAGARRLKDAIAEQMDGAAEPQELAGGLIEICHDYLQGNAPSRLKSLQVALAEMYDGKERREQEKRIDTGFPKLDGILKGICPGNLVIIGARPGVGKSAFALDIARTAARKGKRVLRPAYQPGTTW